MKKRLLVICIVLCIWIGMYAAFPVMAKELLGSGTYGQDITWSVYDDKTLVFSGTGATQNGESYVVQGWYVYDDQIENVIFEDGITDIGKYSLYGSGSFYKHIKSVTLSPSIERIGAYAFMLSNLESVYISDLEKYCQIEFANNCHPVGCKADLYLNGVLVEDLVIPETITELQDYAFYGCTSIRNVTIPNSVTRIGDFAFNSCDTLETITFSGKAPEFGEHVFTLSKVTAYYPPNDSSWNEVIQQNFDGAVTWVPSQCNGGHTEQTDAAVAPSCNQTGLTEGKSCSVCGTVLVPQQTVPKTDHTYVSTVTSPICDWHGFTTHTCTGCGDSYETDRVEPLGHNFSEWVVVEMPGPDSDGRKSRECANCGLIEGRALEPGEIAQLTEPTVQPTESPTQPTEPTAKSTEPTPPPTECSTQPTETAPLPQSEKKDDYWAFVILGVLLLCAAGAGAVLAKRRK